MDPEARTYVPAYTEGRRLCRRFLGREDGAFQRLVTEQLTVSSLMDRAATIDT
jgi:hypothetical protein